MAIEIRPQETTSVRDQAAAIREFYPELYAHLVERDRKLRRALGRVPSPADVELSATWNQRKFIEKTLASLGDGVEELAGAR